MKKVLVITEAFLSGNASGFNKTAWSLISSGFHPDEVKVMVPYVVKGMYKGEPDIESNIHFRLYLIKGMRNRLSVVFGQLIKYMNYIFRNIYTRFIDVGDDISTILVIPNTFEVLHTAYLLSVRCSKPLSIFLMDDWLYSQSLSYERKIVQSVMDRASGFLFISGALKDSMYKRYELEKPYQLYFNPLRQYLNREKAIKEISDNCKLCYVGSIYEMHNSLFTFIEFLNKFNNSNTSTITLDIYTTKQIFESSGLKGYLSNHVQYVGFLDYDSLLDTICKYDFGLLSTSFTQTDSIKNIVSTSLLTKLNDYVSAGLPIMCYGPSYSASNNFVKKHELGVEISSNTYSQFSEKISAYMRDKMLIRDKVKHASQYYHRVAFDNYCNSNKAAFFVKSLVDV